MEEYINGTAATLTKPGSDETRPDLTVSFRLERGDQFLIGFQFKKAMQQARIDQMNWHS